MKTSRITLAKAIEEGRLSDFIDQAEADGIGPIDAADFDQMLGRVIKAPQLEGRTSRSPADGDSRGS